MTSEPTIAIAVSARSWPGELRQTLADHGGGRVRLTAMSPLDLADEEYSVLLIDDICSFLDRGLVAAEQARGRIVVGVHDDAWGRSRLASIGVDAMIAADAPASEFVSLIARVGPRSRTVPEQVPRPVEGPDVLVVRGAAGGVGTTEIALAVATRLTDVVIVDAADRPSLAQRTGLALHPNLATAAEVVDHGSGDLTSSIQRVTRGVGLIAGVGGGADAPIGRIVRALGAVASRVVVDAGSSGLRNATGVEAREMLVGTATPVGVTRCLDQLGVEEASSIHLILNRAPRSRFQRSELSEAVLQERRPASLTFVADDPRVTTAVWNGVVVGRGRFTASIRALAESLVAEAA